MNLATWYYIGIAILSLDIVWLSFFYYYGSVKIYNFCEDKRYCYLGYLWIHKKRGEWYLEIPEDMIDASVTTKYKIVSAFWFHKFQKGKKMHIDFAGKCREQVRISSEIIVDNYITTSRYL